MVDHEKHSENSVDKTVERTYERLGESAFAIGFRTKPSRETSSRWGGMTEIYCADHHDPSERVPFESEATKAGVYPTRKIPSLCPELRGASALRRNPPCVMQTRTSPLVQDMRQPLLRARRGGVAAHGHGLRRTTCPVSRTCHRSGAAPDSNETEIGELSCRAGCGRFFRASQPRTALRCSPSSHRAAILA